MMHVEHAPRGANGRAGLDLVIISKYFVVGRERRVNCVGWLALQALNEKTDGVGVESYYHLMLRVWQFLWVWGFVY